MRSETSATLTDRNSLNILHRLDSYTRVYRRYQLRQTVFSRVATYINLLTFFFLGF